MDKDTYDIRTRNGAEVRVCGRFKPNGSSAITNTLGSTIFGAGFSVARSTTGVFALTIKGLFGALLHGTFTLWTSTITDGGQFRIVSVAESGGNTIVTITHFGEDAGGLMAIEDIAAASDNFISFDLTFDNRKGTRR